MKKLMYIILVGTVLGGCQKFLDRQPLDSISSTNFLTNESEIKLGLTGVYLCPMELWHYQYAIAKKS